MKALGVLFAIGAMGLAGCAATRGYNGALSDKAAPSGNAQRIAATPERAFRAAAGTLVQRGFTVEQADSAMGLIKASRNLQDQKAHRPLLTPNTPFGSSLHYFISVPE